jgi:hypothetical protein
MAGFEFMTKEEKARVVMATPSGFAREVMGFRLHAKQEAIVEEFRSLRGRKKVAVSAPNGAGKSSKINATIIVRTICVKPQAKVIVTSADARQISEQIWPAVERHKHLMKEVDGWHWTEHDHTIRSPKGGFVIMFTTKDSGRAEGWHAEFDEANGIDSPCMIIVDEAKSVEEQIFEAFSARCTFNGLFYISSTGLMQGSFYRAMCGEGGFKRYSLGLADCPHIPKQRVEELLEEYKGNLDHPLLRSTLYGEFMDFTGDRGRFCTMAEIKRCLENPPDRRSGETVAFCDFAGGGSENVLAVRRGNYVRLVRCWKEHDEMRAVTQFITLFRDEGLEADQIWGDNSGAGKPMVARFHQLGWPIKPFNGGADALRSSDYCNRVAECWEYAGRDIKNMKVILPLDEKLHVQIVSRIRTADARGRIRAESKEDMGERGIASPDRADAIIGAMAIGGIILTNTKADELSWLRHLDTEERDKLYDYILPGADLGNQ